MIIVTGQPRCGTSMMMRCLQKAGVNMAFFNTPRPDEMKKKFRNIHGFYEGEWNGEDGAIKCMRIKKLKDFQDAFFIVMTRDVDKMIKSWNEFSKRDFNKNREKMIGRREKILEFVSENRIVVDYDEFVNNPEKYKNQFDENNIDFEKLKTGIDKKIYKRR